MKIAIACDHAGIEIKQLLIKHLESKGIILCDFGLTGGDPAADYPDYALPATEAVASGDCDKGILICGTGIGMSLVANKVKGIRCAVCTNIFMAEATRQHNDANMLALGARVVSSEQAIEIADAFVFTEFSNAERHIRRIDKVSAVEEKYFK